MEKKRRILLYGGKICKILDEGGYFPDDLYKVRKIVPPLCMKKSPPRTMKFLLKTAPADLILVDLAALLEEYIKAPKEKAAVLDYAKAAGRIFAGTNRPVVLLHVNRPIFAVVEDKLRNQDVNAHAEKIKAIEESFAGESHCMICDLSNAYFSKKYYGEAASLYHFEEEYYKEIVARVTTFLGEGGDTFSAHADIGFCMERLIRYYDTISVKAFRSFLQTGNVKDELLLSASKSYLTENKVDLINWYEQDEEMPVEVSDGSGILSDENKEIILKNALLMTRHILEDRYDSGAVDFVSYFAHGFRSEKLLGKVRIWVRDHIEEVGIRHQKQVTFHNYGIYFLLMVGRRDLISNLIKELNGKNADTFTTLPVAVDIWGSCVSRLNINFDFEKTFVASIYNFQVPPILYDQGIPFDADLLKGCNTWYDRLVERQLNGNLPKQVRDKKMDWILIDFFSLTSKRMYEKDGLIFNDYNEKIAKKIGAKLFDIRKLDIAQWEKWIDEFAGFLKEEYGKRIILIRSLRQEQYISQEGKILDFPEKDIDHVLNEKVKAVSDYFAEKTGCYYIDFVDQFLADELSLLKLAVVHYENVYYREVMKIISHIVKDEPEEHYFATYDMASHLDRKIRFKEDLNDVSWGDILEQFSAILQNEAEEEVEQKEQEREGEKAPIDFPESVKITAYTTSSYTSLSWEPVPDSIQYEILDAAGERIVYMPAIQQKYIDYTGRDFTVGFYTLRVFVQDEDAWYCKGKDIGAWEEDGLYNVYRRDHGNMCWEKTGDCTCLAAFDKDKLSADADLMLKKVYIKDYEIRNGGNVCE